MSPNVRAGPLQSGSPLLEMSVVLGQTPASSPHCSLSSLLRRLASHEASFFFPAFSSPLLLVATCPVGPGSHPTLPQFSVSPSKLQLQEQEEVLWKHQASLIFTACFSEAGNKSFYKMLVWKEQKAKEITVI